MRSQPAKLPLESPPAATVAHFSTASWCAVMFQAPETYRPLLTSNRIPKTTTSEDRFLAVTLATSDTIREWQSFYKPDSFPTSPCGEFWFLFSLGNGMDGHAGLLHGGFISMLCDEMMTMAASFYRDRGTHGMTAYMHVDYKKPIPTPSFLLGRSRMDEARSSGRKIFVTGSLEDGTGGVFATADCLVIEVKHDPARL